MSDFYERGLRSRWPGVEIVILLGVLALGGLVTWAVIDATNSHMQAERERLENKKCRNIAGHEVECSKPED